MNTVTELPFNKLLNLEAATDEAHLLRLPAGGQYLNHLGTVHAGALLALAEASSGELPAAFARRNGWHCAGRAPIGGKVPQTGEWRHHLECHCHR